MPTRARRNPAPVQRELFAPAQSAAPIPKVKGTPVYVGTSGWQFADWAGAFYPPGTPAARMLDCYTAHFPAVELNSSYYGIPRPATVERLADRTPAGFRVAVKAYRGITHDFEGPAVFGAFADSLQPLRESGKLAAILLQFPPSFRDSPENRDFLSRAADALRTVGDPVVEFRHKSWDAPDVPDWLTRERISYCCVDSPALPYLISRQAMLTGPVGYVRLHSRNAANWNRGASARYDYLYSADELGEWVDKLPELAPAPDGVLVFFNNCTGGQAPANAELFLDLLQSSPLTS